jgi:hypothetical protein
MWERKKKIKTEKRQRQIHIQTNQGKKKKEEKEKRKRRNKHIFTTPLLSSDLGFVFIGFMLEACQRRRKNGYFAHPSKTNI